MENVVGWLLGGLMLRWLSYTLQVHQPRDCTFYSGLGAPVPIHNQDNAPLSGPHANLI